MSLSAAIMFLDQWAGFFIVRWKLGVFCDDFSVICDSQSNRLLKINTYENEKRNVVIFGLKFWVSGFSGHMQRICL
jgi:hypothetical protein